MTKKPRIMISLSPPALNFVDKVIEEANRLNQDRRMTRSSFIESCIQLMYHMSVGEPNPQNQNDQRKEN